MKNIAILPTYNEAENLENLVRAILKVRDDIDVMVIDDSSPDGTGDIADKLVAEDQRVKVIHRPPKSGRGSATIAGFKYAIDNGYDFVVEMDVDFSHNPEEIPSLLKAAESADIVIASRFIKGGGVEGWNWVRKLIHFCADLSVKVILGTPNTEHTNGFRCYRVEKLKNIAFDKLGGFGFIGIPVLENIFFKLGYRLKEVPSFFKNREQGTSKMGKNEMIHGLSNMIKFRWRCIRNGIKYYTTC